mmetsp:Transcript_31495/g.57056  ORF Transcript_31495/g.57056 Transcript_31495/m.57056 type:complete len:248 (-) Transcript_31495:207-950(-)|eukprot:CAMPEP_0201890436 /NCGR_PEP_ID=MMETSP0902-20130614/32207_1 /ASSEMBLY_ACC=CAM_ASM_000551 /TAXON_ID=420261 /ORGANISM="Thalassiosira antarctica, Strain CCMP982" /LENGTH=247 /DNA_ID=CAMNT_0048421305 /DNA_START=201 /DNA_END=944 /DNA_ORIENTATION=-
MNLKIKKVLLALALKCAPVKGDSENWNPWSDSADRRGDGEHGEHCNLAFTNPRTNECDLPACDWDWGVEHFREFRFEVGDGSSTTGSSCDIEIREYDWGVTGWWFRGGCKHTATMGRNALVKMHYRVEIGLVPFVAPQIEVRSPSNCGDALLIDGAELDVIEYADGRHRNRRIGTWGNINNNIGWCLSSDPTDTHAFGSDNAHQICPKQWCFDVNINSADMSYCGHCISSPRPNIGCSGSLRGTTDE